MHKAEKIEYGIPKNNFRGSDRYDDLSANLL